MKKSVFLFEDKTRVYKINGVVPSEEIMRKIKDKDDTITREDFNRFIKSITGVEIKSKWYVIKLKEPMDREEYFRITDNVSKLEDLTELDIEETFLLD